MEKCSVRVEPGGRFTEPKPTARGTPKTYYHLVVSTNVIPLDPPPSAAELFGWVPLAPDGFFRPANRGSHETGPALEPTLGPMSASNASKGSLLA